MSKQLAITSGGVHKAGKKAYLTVGGIHRKIIKMYRTTNGIHQLCYKGGVDVATMVIGYSGNMIDNGVVTMSGKQYRLLRLTSSGTLTVDENVNAEVWMCGGGTSGISAYMNAHLGGGGGAGGFTAKGNVTLSGSMAAVVGAGGAAPGNGASTPVFNKGGASSFAGISTSTNFTGQTTDSGVSGGTGGGGAAATYGDYQGNGDGVDKHPFNDASYDNIPMCAGGGAGCVYSEPNSRFTLGGNGGTNGGNGVKGTRLEYGTFSPSTPSGGYNGGGNGGIVVDNKNAYDGGAATYYGSAGGGGAYSAATVGVNVRYKPKKGGAGYQGVIYIRIPLEQAG